MATTTALALKSLFYQYMGQYRSGTATGGSTASLVDSSLINLASDQFPMPLEGKQIRITGGASTGDLRYIAKVDHATGTIYVNRAFSSTGPAVATTYEIWGNSIEGGQALTNLLNEVLTIAKPVQQTQVTIVTDQRIYDITTLVDDPDDVIEVYVRSLDPANLEPYLPRVMFWWKAYPVIASSIQAMKLEIAYPLTLQSPAVEELWVQHRKRLADFTADTSTIDATYKEWLAWEAVFAHALRMTEGSADKGRWQDMARRAAARVRAYRKSFMPHIPRRAMHGRPQVM